MSDTTGAAAASRQDADHELIPVHLLDYARDQENLSRAAHDIERYLEELARRASIPVYDIDARVKSFNSYHKKSQKTRPDGTLEYHNPAKQIQDCVAARVLVFTTRTRNDLADLVENHTEVVERKNPGANKYNGYDSEHLIVTHLSKSDERNRYLHLAEYLSKYGGLEIQIRTVAGHAWAEYEHDVRYKPGAYEELPIEDKKQIDQWFVEAGGMRRVMDELFGMIEGKIFPVDQENLEAIQAGVQTDDNVEDPIDDENPQTLDIASLQGFIATRFPGCPVGDSEAVAELLEHTQNVGIHTIGELDIQIANVEQDKMAKLMDYPSETSGTRRLDDELLATFADRYIDVERSDERKQFLRLRLRRVRGKFAIYAIEDGQNRPGLMTAARAVRETARLVANNRGIEVIEIENAVSSVKANLNPSTKARTVRTNHGSIYVATNMTRSWAEAIMQKLVHNAPGSHIRILRAGEILMEAEPLSSTRGVFEGRAQEGA